MFISNDKTTSFGANNQKGHPSIMAAVALGKNHVFATVPSPPASPDLQDPCTTVYGNSQPVLHST